MTMNMCKKAAPEELLEGIKNGQRVAMGKMISFVENEPEKAQEILDKIYLLGGNAMVLGITGTQGAGKSTLVEKIVGIFREKGLKVGIIAVDPSSPFSGGAFLGDRVRMVSFGSDDKIFMRSVGTRGAVGGLSAACGDIVRVMDASGVDIIVIETVGIGQDETEIIKIADIRVLVLMPGMGDQIQFAKAGTMEIADMFVVNKSDYPESEKTAMWIDLIIDTYWSAKGWKPSVVRTNAIDGSGVVTLVDNIMECAAFQKKNSDDSAIKQRRINRIRTEIASIIKRKIFHKMEEELKRTLTPRMVDEILEKKRSSYYLGNKIFDLVMGADQQ